MIEKPLLHFIQPVCEQIRRGPPQPDFSPCPTLLELLLRDSSVARLCANVLRHLDPGHDFPAYGRVADVASTVDLMSEAADVPAIHEEVFHGGQRLPHRDLDELIMRKIDAGEWLVAERRQYLEDSDWILLQTRK